MPSLKSLVIIRHILVKGDMGDGCSELQARMRRCQKSRHEPRGGLWLPNWALVMTISGELDARGKDASGSGQVVPIPEIGCAWHTR